MYNNNMAAAWKKKIYLTKIWSHDPMHTSPVCCQRAIAPSDISIGLHYLRKTLRPQDLYSWKLKLSA
jgi:hypothetical protein